MKLSSYTFRYSIVALLGVIALWATLFYMVIIEEVYDNIDDGLKNSKLQIIRETKKDPALLNTPEYGIHQFTIKPLPPGGTYAYTDKFTSTFEYMEYDEDDEPVRLLTTVFNDSTSKPHLLTIRASMVEEDEFMEDFMTALIALYIMLVISIALINRLILNKVWKSFYTMLGRLKNYRLGAGSTFSVPETNITEFKALSTELNSLLRRNEEVYASQKQFIENASHELQTPLAISINKIELLAEKASLAEEHMAELAKINDTLHRLVRLNKSLLILSKIENRQFTDEKIINLNEVVYKAAEDLADLADYKNVKVTIESQGQLTKAMNADLVMIMLSNLIKNATIHNEPDGYVKVIVTSSSIVIENTGSTGALDSARLFSRFYREKDNSQSTGLGLSIVKAITDTYGYTLSYKYTGSHFFKIDFKI